jgi:hypothetical protein
MVKKPKPPHPRPAPTPARAARVVEISAQASFTGVFLMKRILAEGARRGLGVIELARESLGVTDSHFRGLCNGSKEVNKLGPEAIAQAARFLNSAPINIMLAAGQLTLDDFNAGPGRVEDHLQPALRFILEDPELGSLVHPKILNAEPEVQRSLVWIYQLRSGIQLIPGQVTKPDIIKRHHEMSREQPELLPNTGGVTAYERMIRACRELGITLKSRRLRNGTFVEALGVAIHATAWGTQSNQETAKSLDVAKAVEMFGPELSLLDSLDPEPDVFQSGVVAAALLALALDPATRKFFELLSAASGSSARQPVPIRDLLALMGTVSGPLRTQELCEITLHAVNYWKKSQSHELAKEPLGSPPSRLLVQTVQRVRASKERD